MQRRATKLPAEHSPACIESRHAHGHLQNWRKKPACRAQCLRSVLRISWDIRRSPILRRRLQLAARLLETTDHSALQVALDVGYESEAAFNRAFKRKFELPPGRYRRQARVQA